jgi:hypothetical protein
MAGENHPRGYVKAYWLPVGFVAGIALGVFIERPAADAPVAPPTAPAVAHAAPEKSPPSHVPTAGSSPAPAQIPAASVVPVRPVAAMTQGVAAAEAPAGGPPIDPGPVFAKQFAEAEKAGFRNPLAEQHAALERETRDDSWAYQMEAELQNSMVADTSMGNFKLEHLECRSTLCEMQLSANGEQQSAALRKWQDGLHTGPPPGLQLMLTSASVITENDASNALIILTKPPSPKH